MKTTTTAKCEYCAHCQAIKVDGMVIETVCRRFPPVVILDGRSSAYPLILDDDLCGEYKAAK